MMLMIQLTWIACSLPGYHSDLDGYDLWQAQSFITEPDTDYYSQPQFGLESEYYNPNYSPTFLDYDTVQDSERAYYNHYQHQNRASNNPEASSDDFHQVYASDSLHYNRLPMDLDHSGTSALPATDQNEKKIDRFDLSKVPILPYYMIATLRFPITINRLTSWTSLYSNEKAATILQSAIHNSAFNLDLDLEDHQLVSIFTDDAIQNSDTNSAQPLHTPRFLVKLCLSALSFLNLLHENIDETIQNELIKVLDGWNLCSNRHDGYSESQIGIQSVAEKTFTTHEIPTRIYIRESGRSSRDRVSSDFQADEARVILDILGNYFKSTNPELWKRLFPEDIDFLKLYQRFVVQEVNNSKKDFMSTHWHIMKDLHLLPWDDSTLPPNNQLKGTFFHTDFKSLSQLVSGHMEYSDVEGQSTAQQHWEELMEYDSHQAIPLPPGPSKVYPFPTYAVQAYLSVQEGLEDVPRTIQPSRKSNRTTFQLPCVTKSSPSFKKYVKEFKRKMKITQTRNQWHSHN